MSLLRVKGGLVERFIMPGDILAGGESALAGALTTIGAGTWTGAQIATGIIYRTGPTGAYTDTTDTSTNIIAAFGGTPDTVPGTSFRLLLQNSVAFALTFAAGVGCVAGNGVLNVAASTVREYLVTVLNSSQQQLMQCNTTNASAVVTFVLPPNAVAFPLVGSNGISGATTITPGMTVSGTGITAGTTVIGITQGQGGAVGVTLSANATATSSGGVALTFLPTIKFDGLFSTTL